MTAVIVNPFVADLHEARLLLVFVFLIACFAGYGVWCAMEKLIDVVQVWQIRRDLRRRNSVRDAAGPVRDQARRRQLESVTTFPQRTLH